MSDEPISYEEARALVENGDWVFDPVYFDDIRNAIIERYCALSDARGWNKLSDEDRKKITTAASAFLATVRSTSEAQQIYFFPPEPPNPYPNPRLELRLGHGKILKVAPTYRKTRLSILGVIGVLTAVADWNTISYLSTLCLVAQPMTTIIQALATSYERLTDPAEIAVFEAIAHLEGQQTFENPDAVARCEPDALWHIIAPTLDEVADYAFHGLRPAVQPPAWVSLGEEAVLAEITRAAEELRRRDILRERHGRWTIVI